MEDYIARLMALAAAQGGGGSDSYSKSEIDSFLDEKVTKIAGKSLSTNDYSDTEKQAVADATAKNAAQDESLARLLNSGAKNLVLPPHSSDTIPGVTVSLNADGSITLDGTCTASTFKTYIFGTPLLPAGSYRLSGCPSGGSGSTFELSCGGGGLAKVTDFGNGAQFALSAETQLTYIQIVARPGAVFSHTTFFPMICTADDYTVSPAYVPYAPDNRQLYEMILALQNGG